MLYVDIPTPADILALVGVRDEACVSIYLRTTPLTQQAQSDRIELKNLARNALKRLEEAGADKRRRAAVAEQLDDLVDDYEFWRFQAHSLAVFATPENVRTFRVPNALEPLVVVSDRFHVKPLLRAVSFPQSCYVLALAQKTVRVIEVSPDLPSTAVHVEGMPEDAGRAVSGLRDVGDWPRSPRPRTRASAAGVRGPGGYWPSGRIQAAEGQKVLLRQFARNIDKVLRPLLTGSGIPLVLAATEPLASIYRSVNTYSFLAGTTIEGSPEAMTEAQLGEQARAVLDGIYGDELAAWRSFFETRSNQGRATTDIAQAARAATVGAVDSMLVDIDEVIPGRIDDDGAVVFAEQVASNYDLVDEIATRVIAAGGRAIGVRKADIPRLAALAVVLRYPV